MRRESDEQRCWDNCCINDFSFERNRASVTHNSHLGLILRYSTLLANVNNGIQAIETAAHQIVDEDQGIVSIRLPSSSDLMHMEFCVYRSCVLGRVPVKKSQQILVYIGKEILRTRIWTPKAGKYCWYILRWRSLLLRKGNSRRVFGLVPCFPLDIRPPNLWITLRFYFGRW